MRDTGTQSKRSRVSSCCWDTLLTGLLADAFRYKWNTDKQVTVLKFTDLDGDGMGMLR